MTITHMNRSHIPSVAKLEEMCFSLPWLEATYERELQKANAANIVALEGGEVIGFVNAHFVLDECNLNRIAVHPAHRRAGVADYLLTTLEGACKVRGASVILLDVRVGNEAARALYFKHGYVVSGRRPGYYQRPAEDAILLTKFLQG